MALLEQARVRVTLMGSSAGAQAGCESLDQGGNEARGKGDQVVDRTE